MGTTRRGGRTLGALILAQMAGSALVNFSLLPRALGAAGLAAVVLQLTGVAMPLFGHPVSFPLLAPLGLCG